MNIKINSNFQFSVASIQFAPDGELVISLVSGDTIRDREYQYTASLGSMCAEERKPVSLAQYAMDFAERSNIKPKTKLSYMLMVKHLEKYGDTSLDKVTTSYLQGFISHLRSIGLKNGTVRLDFQKLACVLHDAYKNELFDDRILQRVKRPKKDQCKKCFLTESEIKRLQKNPLPERHKNIHDMFLFSCMTGLRFSDLQELKWNNIRHSGKHLWVEFCQRKTGTIERLPLGTGAETLLHGLSRSGPYVFGRVSNQWANAVIRRWCRKARVRKPVTFHSGRHSFCVMLLAKGVPIYTVQRLMCHSDIGTTNVYADITGRTKAMAVRKLPSLTAVC